MKFTLSTLLAASVISFSAQAVEVVAFWGFEDDYDTMGAAVSKIDFAADVDNTSSNDANLQAFLGNADNLDQNGGGGFGYTSPTSGIAYGGTRSVKFDDVRGGGNDFDILGVSSFSIDRNDDLGVLAGEDFGNDGLIYITLSTLGFNDLSIRFDIESTPGFLAESFDLFYRVGGSGTWFRDSDQNNIPITGYTSVDADNSIAESGSISLNSLLANQASVEIIINDFAEFGNNELELDNFEIIGEVVPEPSSALLSAFGMLALLGRRRR